MTISSVGQIKSDLTVKISYYKRASHSEHFVSLIFDVQIQISKKITISCKSTLTHTLLLEIRQVFLNKTY